MSWTYLIVITSRCGRSIVGVVTMIVYCSGCCLQYQLMFSWMEQRYCALTTNSPAEITCPSIVVLFCSVYASERNWMIYNTFVVVSYVLMAPNIPDWTNEATFNLICQAQPYISHQTLQKVFILVTDQWYYNCYMSPELDNK